MITNNRLAPPPLLKSLSTGDLEILASACTLHIANIRCGCLRRTDSIKLTLQDMGAMIGTDYAELGKLGEICADIDQHTRENPENLIPVMAAGAAALDETQRRTDEKLSHRGSQGG
jgi:hypothetical protein